MCATPNALIPEILFARESRCCKCLEIRAQKTVLVILSVVKHLSFKGTRFFTPQCSVQNAMNIYCDLMATSVHNGHGIPFEPPDSSVDSGQKGVDGLSRIGY